MLNKLQIISLIFFPFILFFAIFLSKKLKLVDKPNFRKVHQTDVVNTSGFLISSYMLYITGISEFSKLLESNFGMFFL